MIGTARSGRKGWPQVSKELKALKKALKRGESKSVTVEDGKVECLVWKDNTVVPLVNTITKPQEMTHVKRTNKDGSKIDVSYPESIKSYNKQVHGRSRFVRFKKENLLLLKEIQEVVATLILLPPGHDYCECLPLVPAMPGQNEPEGVHLGTFYQSLASHTSRKHPNTVQTPVAARLQERHFPDKMEDPHQCVVCPERRRSRVCCRDCDPEHPIPLCITPCFRIHHTVEKTKKKNSKK